ncbi:MAG: Spx/MgsR family RNA polymerase-binding regulatory protein [Bacilli bacterium]|nr:Spx/MgsR family RNA polymerase-binding regulatory protein [Bacilli bacterium]
MIILYHPKCSTCKKAIKFLKDNNISFIERNIILENPKKEEIKKWIKQSGKDIKKFFNTSGMKYRELNLKEKLKNMTDEEKINVLSKDGMLVKRPILITDDKILIGFKEDEWKKRIKKEKLYDMQKMRS